MSPQTNQNIGNVPQSAIEDMRDFVVEQVKTISPENGYRTTVQNNVVTYFADMKNITHWPTIAVLLGNENTKANDSNCTVWHSDVDVMFIAYVKVEDCEPALHDLKKLIAGMILSNINEPANRWVIMATEMGEGMLKVGRYFIAGSKTGFASITFSVRMLNQDSTFSPLDLNAGE